MLSVRERILNSNCAFNIISTSTYLFTFLTSLISPPKNLIYFASIAIYSVVFYIQIFALFFLLWLTAQTLLTFTIRFEGSKNKFFPSRRDASRCHKWDRNWIKIRIAQEEKFFSCLTHSLKRYLGISIMCSSFAFSTIFSPKYTSPFYPSSLTIPRVSSCNKICHGNSRNMLDEALIDRRRVPLSKRCTKKNQGGSLKKIVIQKKMPMMTRKCWKGVFRY